MGDAAREAEVSEAFVALTSSLVSGYDVIDLLRTLVERAVDLLDATTAGLVLRDEHGGVGSIASTSEDSELLELMQLRSGQGPCIEACDSGHAVSMVHITPDAGHDPRWPAFQAAASARGFRSVHTVPLRLREQSVGALNLFRDWPGALPAEDAALAQALADVATISILQQRTLHESATLAEQLQEALDSRVVVEQAKGIIAQQSGLDVDAAFTILRRYTRAHGEHLRDVARAVVEHRIDVTALTAAAGD